MDKTKVTRRRATPKAPKRAAEVKAAFDDFVPVLLDVERIGTSIELHHYALIGCLHEAVDCKPPVEDVPGFVMPVVEGLMRLKSNADDLKKQLIDAVLRLRAACGAAA